MAIYVYRHTFLIIKENYLRFRRRNFTHYMCMKMSSTNEDMSYVLF